ncbi:hypothetical protein E2562_005309 [Oryza meyeriana var. granulata]|uniref:DUF6821 domain-containing protein n=1 Tax=Oryza meyeriana var. granulata TaxID=110450 RepID=A0A6G1DEN4_9ORYZ|nr:hypothetical protein E2562_005309 [Oryza meyeriana var. granulata]
MSRGASMDAISLDEWELLPDNKSSFFMEEFTSGHGTVGDDETKKPLLSIQISEEVYVGDPVVKFKDIDVAKIEPNRDEFVPKVTEIFDAEEETEMIKSPFGAEEVDVDEEEVMVVVAPDQCVEEEEGVQKDREHNGFSVGKLRVNGVGALCSFGVAAATFCIFLLGGRQQQLDKRQNQKNQFQMYADNEKIQQVVQQASRLNQAVSTVMGGAATRASISFGGYYDGF